MSPSRRSPGRERQLHAAPNLLDAVVAHGERSVGIGGGRTSSTCARTHARWPVATSRAGLRSARARTRPRHPRAPRPERILRRGGVLRRPLAPLAPRGDGARRRRKARLVLKAHGEPGPPALGRPVRHHAGQHRHRRAGRGDAVAPRSPARSRPCRCSLRIGAGATLGTICALAVVTYGHVVFGELAPRSAALNHPEEVARWLVPPLHALRVGRHARSPGCSTSPPTLVLRALRPDAGERRGERALGGRAADPRGAEPGGRARWSGRTRRSSRACSSSPRRTPAR